MKAYKPRYNWKEWLFTHYTVNTATQVATTDYAANMGDAPESCCFGSAPESLDKAGDFQWPNLEDHKGISYAHSLVGIADVTDGISNTYRVGQAGA